MQIREAPRIRRRRFVPEDDRTEDRDKAADYIQKEVITAGRWPMTMTEIADETGYSRQHIANTLDAYFEPVNGEGDEPAREERTIHSPNGPATVEIPPDVDNESYLRGFVAGLLHEQ